MRTGRSLTVCCSLLPGGCLLPGRGAWSGGCLLRGWGGVPGLGGCGWSGGGVGIPACTEADTPPPTSPPVDRQTPVKILPWPNFVAAGKNYKGPVSVTGYTSPSGITYLTQPLTTSNPPPPAQSPCLRKKIQTTTENFTGESVKGMLRT